jgi:hypothetical protein
MFNEVSEARLAVGDNFVAATGTHCYAAVSDCGAGYVHVHATHA